MQAKCGICSVGSLQEALPVVQYVVHLLEEQSVQIYGLSSLWKQGVRTRTHQICKDWHNNAIARPKNGRRIRVQVGERTEMNNKCQNGSFLSASRGVNFKTTKVVAILYDVLKISTVTTLTLPCLLNNIPCLNSFSDIHFFSSSFLLV